MTTPEMIERVFAVIGVMAVYGAFAMAVGRFLARARIRQERMEVHDRVERLFHHDEPPTAA